MIVLCLVLNSVRFIVPALVPKDESSVFLAASLTLNGHPSINMRASRTLKMRFTENFRMSSRPFRCDRCICSGDSMASDSSLAVDLEFGNIPG